MNLPFFIAKRYILGKKSHNAINIVSAISVTGVVIGTMAFILILSVFNGFDQLVKGMYNSFYPDVKILPTEGKVFSLPEDTLNLLKEIEGVEHVAYILEDNAMIMYKGRPTHAVIRGVSENYNKINNIESLIWHGKYDHYNQVMPLTVLGRGIFFQLGMARTNEQQHLKVVVPKRNAPISHDPNKTLNQRIVAVSGVFASQPEIDGKYAIVPLKFAREMFNYPSEFSALEIRIDSSLNEKNIMKNIETLLGEKLLVKDRYQQNELLYKTMRTEKWAIFMILALVLVILLFSLVGSLSMLIIEKKKDIQILNSLGANQNLIQKIFFREGIMITFTGALIGLITGSVIALLQEKFKLVKLEGGFVIDAYPVDIQVGDFLIVTITVMLIGAIASYYPLRFLLKRNIEVFRYQ